MSYRQNSAYTRGHQSEPSIYSANTFSTSLSLLSTLNLNFSFFRQGFSDSFKWNSVKDVLMQNKIVQGNTMKSSLVQIIVLLSALILEPLLLSTNSRDSSKSIYSTISILFHIFWLYPLSLAAIYYAGLIRSNRDGDRRPSGSNGGLTKKGVADSLVTESYRGLLLLNYFAVVYILNLIPYAGPFLSFLYASIVDSYYCFESVWLKQNYSFGERVSTLQSRWAYFLGFGIPITICSCWSSDPVANLAIFSLLYPFYNIMAQSAIAQPLDPDLPTSSLSLSFLPQAKGSSFSMNAVEGGEEDRGRSGHPYVPKNLPVLILAEKLYGLVAQQVSSSSKKKDAGGVRSNYGGGGGQDVGWRGDQRPSGRNQPPPQSSPYQYPSAEGQPPAQTYGYATNEGSRRPQGGFGDKTMDSLISAAARRSKRD